VVREFISVGDLEQPAPVREGAIKR